MTIGTAFTLFFVPAIYLLIARDHRAEERDVEPSPLVSPKLEVERARVPG
jgi:multidrug efflux pump